MEPQAVEPKLLGRVQLANSGEWVRVILDGREGSNVFVRQADPCDGDDFPPVPIFEGDEVIVMTAISHTSTHTTEGLEDHSGYLFSHRVVPVRTEGNVVFARSLRLGESDDGRRVHMRPGAQLTFEAGSIVIELDAIDAAEAPSENGYVPLTPALWTWLVTNRGFTDSTKRYVLSAARRLDKANSLTIEIARLRNLVLSAESAPATRRAAFELIGTVEVAVIALGRAIDMAWRAPSLLDISKPVPRIVLRLRPTVTAIRNAYEHIEDRALGQVQQTPNPAALSIFDQAELIENNIVTYDGRSLNLATDVPAVIGAVRIYLKQLVGDAQ